MTLQPPGYFETPLTLAVLRLFERVLPLLEGKSAGAFKAYIFGGCALHILTNARGSADVDAELEIAAALRQVDNPELSETGPR